VKIIHERDQFIQAIQPASFELQHGINASYGENAAVVSLIAVNFTDVEQSVQFVFTQAGNYTSNCTVWIILPSRQARRID
jgi:hypothetical protein